MVKKRGPADWQVLIVYGPSHSSDSITMQVSRTSPRQVRNNNSNMLTWI